ncbi:MAG TPA: aminotransferase class V-fold PLP-dependent enzyme [Vicinamibacterales bacterium]|nr:aminotransferase class V-fold PLP-dependent enzyme [Vicinamibacterales bacterium]
MNPDEFRSRFPILERRVYVNSCSQGALSIDVEQGVRSYLESWHDEGSPWERWVDQVERLRARFAASIGADTDEVAVMPSASAGINAIASALDFGGARSHVVVGEFEFPTMAQVWLAQARRGAVIRRASAPPTAPDTLPLASYDAVIDERTLIVPATHVCFRNGHKTDIAGLVRLAHGRGAYVLLDDYQRTGSGPIDVHALNVDFMVTGCLKYLIAAAGIGFLYVRRDLVERFEPTVTGWFGRVNPFAFRIDALDWPSSANRFESGTPPVANAYAALAALDLLDRIGYDAIGRQVDRLTARFAGAAREAGFAVRTPIEADRRGPLVVVQSLDAPALVQRLAASGIVASCRGNGLRVAFHAYNTDADVDAVVGALHAEASLVIESAVPR